MLRKNQKDFVSAAVNIQIFMSYIKSLGTSCYTRHHVHNYAFIISCFGECRMKQKGVVLASTEVSTNKKK